MRTLFDKLEDQTLYLSQQLARQQEDLRGFYERMGHQTEGLKDLLMSLDLSKLESEAKQGSGGSTTSLSDEEKGVNLRMSYKISGKTYTFSLSWAQFWNLYIFVHS